MADIIVDGMTAPWFIPTVADPVTGITVAEITAGQYLGGVIAPGGMEGFEASPGEVDNTSFDSRFDTKAPGVPSFSGTRLILKKQTEPDEIYDLLTEFGTTGFIGVRYDVPKETAPAATQKMTLYPIITGSFGRMAPERNTLSRYWVATPISDEPIPDVPIVATV